MNKKISIIGSGFSALAASCYLAQSGNDVVVYEKNSTIGGRARQLKKDGFTFDIGPTWYWMPDVFERFFGDFNKLPSDYYELIKLSPAYQVYFGTLDFVLIADNLEEIIYNNKSKNEEQILIELKNDLNEISQCKELVNKSKSLMIKINKSKNLLKIKQKLEKNINLNINLLNHHQLEVLNNIMKEYKLFLNIEYDKLNYKIENIISNVDHFDHLDFYSLINFKKNKKNNLEKLIYACNNKTSSYELPKTIFLEHLEIFDNQNNIMQFLKKFHFDFKSNKIKQLKRGFIFEMKKNNQSFIIKYQPNKSFSEIIMNKYLSKYNHLKQFILYPDYIFIKTILIFMLCKNIILIYFII